LFDSGYKEITNIDFSEQVIEVMRTENALRADMKWEIMDMTHISYESESYDAVVDKGALDALMSVNSEEVKAQAVNMFEGIHRVLSNRGKYMCITLAEDYIISHLLGYFTSNGCYDISIHILTSDTPSPFKPFLIIIAKSSSSPLTSSNDPVINVNFDAFGSAVSVSTRATLIDCLDLVPSPTSHIDIIYNIQIICCLSLSPMSLCRFTKCKHSPRRNSIWQQ
jgi:hypothetical protein